MNSREGNHILVYLSQDRIEPRTSFLEEDPQYHFMGLNGLNRGIESKTSGVEKDRDFN